MAVQRSEIGAVAVEMALVLPFLIVLLCGIVDFGLAFQTKLTLAHSAREGVRVWALTQDAAAAEDRAKSSATGLRERNARFSVDTPAACSYGSMATYVVHYEFGYITPLSELMALLPGNSALQDPVSMSATGVMRCGG